ncbi:MAG: hypothetical protein IJR28_07080 [Ottowia sp.]|nr:hypothetical protein [Ottowia sp.]
MLHAKENMRISSQEIRSILESRLFLGSVLALCAANAFCTGFYMPNIWAQNYYTLSFFDGFFRRALIGTILYPLGELRLNYHFISFIQVSVGACLLFMVLRRVLAMKHLNVCIYIYVCVFLFSHYGAFFFNTQGYPEYAMYLLVMLSFGVKNGVLRAFMVAATVWIHEMAVFTCFPLWFALEWIYFGRRKTALAGLAACFVSFAVIYILFQTVEQAVADNYIQFISSSAAYVPKYEYVDVFRSDFLGERFQRLSYYYSEGPFRTGRESLQLAFMLFMACGMAAINGRKEKSFLTAVIIFGAALAPLLMGMFGYDINRWVFLAMVNISVMLVVLSRNMKGGAAVALAAAGVACLMLAPPYKIYAYYRGGTEGLDFVRHLWRHVTSVPLL